MRRYLFIFGCVAVAISSCKTTKKAIIDYEYKGDTYEHNETVRDTSYIEVDRFSFVRDTLVEWQHDTILVQFVQGGGTYNVNTGDMVGVAGVSKITSSSHQYGSSKYTASDSSASRVISSQDSEVKTDEQLLLHDEKISHTDTKSYWWIWFLVGLGTGAGSLILLKKLPYTKPLFYWL